MPGLQRTRSPSDRALANGVEQRQRVEQSKQVRQNGLSFSPPPDSLPVLIEPVELMKPKLQMDDELMGRDRKNLTLALAGLGVPMAPGKLWLAPGHPWRRAVRLVGLAVWGAVVQSRCGLLTTCRQ